MVRRRGMFAGCVIIAAAMIFAATPAMAAYTIDSGTEEEPYIWEGSIKSPEDSVVVAPGIYVESTGGITINGDGSITVYGSWNSTAGAWQLGHTTTGTLNIEAGGIINRPASYMYLGRSGGKGIMNINGGTANFKEIRPDKENTTGEIYQVAGDFTINSLLLGHQAGQSAKYEISGGTSTMGTVTIGSLGGGEYIANGRLEVIGNGATSITATIMKLRDTLAFSFGSAGVTLLEIENLELTVQMATIELNLDSDIATGVYSLFRFDSLTEDSDALDNAVLAGMLDLNYAGSHDVTLGLSGNTVQATVAVPEPATMALLGLGLAGLIARRRKH